MELCALDSERRNGSKGMMEMVGSVGGYKIVTPEKMQTQTQAMNEDQIASLDLDALPLPVSMDMAMPELMTSSMTTDNDPYKNSYPVQKQLSFDTMIADNIDSIFKISSKSAPDCNYSVRVAYGFTCNNNNNSMVLGNIIVATT